MSTPSNSEFATKADRPTWVIGHKNPDTDAICSAIAYADLLRQTRIPSAEAACCGPPNQRTEWVLGEAGIGRPKLMPDVYLRAEDICRSDVATAKITDTVIEAYRQMTALNYRSLPVAGECGSLIGMVALQDLLALLIPETGRGEGARTVNASTRNISRTLGGDFVNETEHCDEEKDYLMMVAGSSEPVMSERIARYPSEQLIIITGDRVGVQLHAVEAGVRCLVITSGFSPSTAIIEAAKTANTAIIVTDHDTAATTQLIRGARSIQGAVSDDYVDFHPDVRLPIIKEKIKSLRNQTLFPVCDPETKKLLGVFSRTDLVNPDRPKLVLVDHNEFSQAVAGADEAQIIEVIDHHRLSGNLITKEPVQFINLAVGSTCTIVGNSFRINKLSPTKSTALCICAGIISDTLNLTSPTTTELDTEILAWASEIAGINVDKFKDFFFAAGSVLRRSDIKQAVGSDRKEFEESGYRLSISQVEEIGFDYFWPCRGALQEELRKLLSERRLDFACLMVTDITLNDSLLLVEASADIRGRISYPKKDPHLFNLKGVVSRKKQLFPYISSVLAEVPETESD